jgi:hypothetical protein
MGRKSKMHTSEAYLSGAICGPIWSPVGVKCGKPLRVDLSGQFKRFSEPATFRDVLELILIHEGGDFQSAKFSADTEIVILRKTSVKPYVYQTRARVRELINLPAFSDLVDNDVWTGDFLDE